MFHPFFNVDQLTDIELVEKTNELLRRLSWAQQHGQAQMAAELRILVDSLQTEYHERIRKKMVEKEEQELSKNPNLKTRFGNDPINLGEINKDTGQ